MKITILCLVFAFAVALALPRPKPHNINIVYDIPKLSEEFTAELSVELHSYDGQLMFGTGMIVRDGKSSAFQQSVMKDQMNFRLDRYDLGDLGMEYYFRGNKSEYHCSYIEPNRTTLFPYWDWVDNSSVIGIHEVEHRSMLMFESEVSGVRYVLGVDPKNTSMPIYLERRNEFDDVIFTFNTFNKYNAKADSKYFEVPDQCKSST